ncbi:hypothetical protein D3C87_248370 [compost metagenome]
MAEKKEYQSMLKLLDATSKIETTANKLGQLGIDAEDPKIKASATNLATWLRSVPAHGKSTRYRVIDMAKNLAAGTNQVAQQQGKAILGLEAYCLKTIASIRPQWQEIALAHGWTPPTAV